jgi:hypothetical protein
MTNDHCSPRMPARGTPATGVVIDGPRADDFDPALKVTESDLRLLDAYYHERAIDASEDPRPNTEEEQAADDALLAAMRKTMSMSPAEAYASRSRRRRR